MKFSMLTFNLRHNRGLKELEKLLTEYQPAILCFQEMETNDMTFQKVQSYGYEVADFSNSVIKSSKVYGVVTFFKKGFVAHSESTSLNLPHSLYEILAFILKGNKHFKAVLKTDITLKSSDKKLTIYNLHLSPQGTHRIREKQIVETFNDLKLYNHTYVLVTGDFNYPYKRKRFEELMHQFGIKEATDNILFTFEYTILGFFSLKLKDDYILYKNLKHIKTVRVEKLHSDHYPIYSEFEI